MLNGRGRVRPDLSGKNQIIPSDEIMRIQPTFVCSIRFTPNSFSVKTNALFGLYDLRKLRKLLLGFRLFFWDSTP